MSQKRGAVALEARDGWWLVHVPKGLLVLSKKELVHALQRGKAWRRRAALAARIEPRCRPSSVCAWQAGFGCGDR